MHPYTTAELDIKHAREAMRRTLPVDQLAPHHPAGETHLMVRIRKELADARELSACRLGLAVLDFAPGLVHSQRAGVAYGPGGQIGTEYPYKGKWKTWAARYHQAGAQVVGQKIEIQDYRGRSVITFPLPRVTGMVRGERVWPLSLTRAKSMVKARLRAAHRAIEAVGPAGQDDRLSILHPWVLGKSSEGLLIGDLPGYPTVVQVVVRDSTTGQRHALTVPTRFGVTKTYKFQEAKVGLRSMRPAEVRGLIHAAIAWTFRLSPAAYRPEVTA